jgi:hypothetical protein
MKHRRYYFLITSLVAQSSIAQETVFFDNLELPEYNAPLNITRQNTPCDILQTLYNTTHLNRILVNDIVYKYTYPLDNRNILTYPTLYTFTAPDSQFNWNIFYQTMPTIFPYANAIDGYLNIFNNIVLHTLDLEIVREYGIQVPRIISLFQNACVEQRRAGFMFDYWQRIKWFSLGLQLPLYAVARNYNWPIEDQQEITTTISEISQRTTPANDTMLPAEKKKAIYPYVLETRLGLGDLRLSLGFHLIEKKYGHLIVGTKITCPTAATLTSGFIGSDFSKCLSRPSVNLEELIEEATDTSTRQQAIEKSLQFFTAALYQLNDTILATQLDDNKRTQCAIYIEPAVQVSPQIWLNADFRANWLLSRNVCRFIKETVNPADYVDADFDPEQWHEPTPECNIRATNALAFLSNRLQAVFLPEQYIVALKPQLELQLTVATQIQFGDRWRFFFGYDYWRKRAECAGAITNCQGQLIPPCSIQTSTALVPRLEQQKLFLKVEYTKFKISHNFIFTLGLDVPLTGKNIADDYTGFVRCEWAL